MNLLCDEPRLNVIGDTAPDLLSAFADDVRAGLSASPKSLSCRYLYDAEGSRLFEEICELPEYYLTRTEASILRVRSKEIVEHLGVVPELIELGSGSAEKTRTLIAAFLERHGELCYRPIDISLDALVASSRDLLRRFERLEVRAIAAEYVAALEELHGDDTSVRSAPRLVLWLGSSIGNFDRESAIRFLSRVRGLLDGGDRMLVGLDLRKERAVLEAAYDDAAGVTARFNENILVRANRDLGANFDIDAFTHRAKYDEVLGRIEMCLVSERAASVNIEALGLEVQFAAGESILTEYSYKYDQGEIEALARASGFEIEAQWTDDERRFALVLLR